MPDNYIKPPPPILHFAPTPPGGPHGRVRAAGASGWIEMLVAHDARFDYAQDTVRDWRADRIELRGPLPAGIAWWGRAADGDPTKLITAGVMVPAIVGDDDAIVGLVGEEREVARLGFAPLRPGMAPPVSPRGALERGLRALSGRLLEGLAHEQLGLVRDAREVDQALRARALRVMAAKDQLDGATFDGVPFLLPLPTLPRLDWDFAPAPTASCPPLPKLPKGHTHEYGSVDREPDPRLERWSKMTYDEIVAEVRQATRGASPAPARTIKCVGCGHCNVYPVGGAASDEELRCTHRFMVDPRRGMMGVLTCASCTLEIPVVDLQRLSIDPAVRFDAQGNALADECQRLRDDNARLLADNARLRIAKDDAERKARRGR